MLYRHLALATAVGALAACASSGSNTTDETMTPTTTTATTDTATTTTGAAGVTGTDTSTTGGVSPTTADSASGRVSTGMAGGEAMAAAQLDTLIAIAERGFTSAPTEAVSAISGFQSYLSSANNPGLSDVSTDLDALKSELQKPTPDQQAVNAALGRIGPKVSAAAATGGAHADRLTRLGQALTKAGGGM